MIYFLRLMAVSIIAAGSLHLVFGLGAEAMLGAELSPYTLINPSLDSQNRFYGTSYCLYGILLWICAQDLVRYAAIFRLILLMTFAGGCARIVSLLVLGWPAPAIIGLGLSELLLPPLLHLWHCQSRARG